MAKKLLEKWEAQKAALEERIRLAKAREKTRERKADNKRKFLVGALVMDWMEKDPKLKDEVTERLQSFLTRASDRRYFGLPPLPQNEAKKAQTKQADNTDDNIDASAA